MHVIASAHTQAQSRQNASQSALSRTGWTVHAGGRQGCAGEEVRLLVELRNHDHLQAVYGRDVAAQALQQLRSRLLQWGAQVQPCGTAGLLARLDAPALQRLRDPRDAGRDRTARDVPGWLEHLQIQLSGAVLHVHGHRVLPLVTVSALPAQSWLDAPRHTWGPAPQRRSNTATDGAGTRGAEARAPVLLNYQADMQLALQWHDALGQGRVSLALQPIRHLHSDEVLYHEALLRVAPPRHATTTPAGPAEAALDAPRLIPALERLGLVRGLDRAVVTAVLQRLQADATLHVGCNLSALSLLQDGWWGEVLQTLRARPDVAERLTLEVTETMPVTDYDAAVAFVRTLETLGCRLALDDVGSGYSTLALARELRPQVIKIDASLLHAARNQADARQTLRRLVDGCQTLAHHVVLEGVENADDLRIAEQLEVQWVQGHGVAPPQAAVPVMAVLPVTAGEPLLRPWQGIGP